MQDVYHVRPVQNSDTEWVTSTITTEWGSSNIVTHGEIHKALNASGYIVFKAEKPVGLITYEIKGNRCEILSLNSFEEKKGIGMALVQKVIETARNNHCSDVFLITTNDNEYAQQFYKNRGFSVSVIRKNVMEASRKLKPEIPLVGINGIPITDEIEMDYVL
jgi:ribosomal protein S18 acetylase RimI-like enzyme